MIHLFIIRNINIMTTTTTTRQISMHNTNILAVNDYDAAGLITPSVPRARNTSDISEGDAAIAAAVASKLTFASIVQMYGSTQSAPFQASPAMIFTDGIYMSQPAHAPSAQSAHAPSTQSAQSAPSAGPSAPFQASPAMILTDGIYMSPSSPRASRSIT